METNWIPNDLIQPKPKTLTSIQEIFLKDLYQFLKHFDPNSVYPTSSHQDVKYADYSMYNGVGGSFYLFLKLLNEIANRPQIESLLVQIELRKTYLEKNLAIMFSKISRFVKEKVSKKGKKRRIAFLTGESGFYYLAVRYGLLVNRKDIVKEYLEKFRQLFNFVTASSSVLDFELLYGVPGFLYSVLRLRSELIKANDSCWKDTIAELNTMILRGVKMTVQIGRYEYQKLRAKKPTAPFRLVYYFHGSEYTGGAHGLAGNLMIFFLCFLRAPEILKEMQEEDMRDIYCSFEFLLSIQNVPQNEDDLSFRDLKRYSLKRMRKLFSENVGAWPTRNNKPKRCNKVQFCHGSPGVVPLLFLYDQLASKIQSNPPQYSAGIKIDYLLSIRKKSRFALRWGLLNIWKEGLIRKGFGLCHGISGNAYSLLMAVQSLNIFSEQEKRNLAEMCRLMISAKSDEKLMKIISEYEHSGRYVVGISDFPFGLMNGSAGDICLQLDFMSGEVNWPGYYF